MEPISGPQITSIGFFDLQPPHEGQNLIIYTVILKYSGPVVACDMSLSANCVAHNLFLISMTSTMLFGNLQPYYVTFKKHMKLKIITSSCPSENKTFT